MRVSRSCKDPELFRKVKEAVSMQDVAEYYGLHVNRKGWCMCPFHQDRNPSLKIDPNGKGFSCFACGTGGDPITFAARFRNIRNEEAAKELAAAFQVPLQEPVTYREKREAEKALRYRRELSDFVKRSRMYLQMYRILLCEASREPQSQHFDESIKYLEYVDYLLECLSECPEEVYNDKKAVRRVGEIEGRIADWHFCPAADGAISG